LQTVNHRVKKVFTVISTKGKEMKFDITIRDLNADNVTQVLKFIANSAYGTAPEVTKMGDFSAAATPSPTAQFTPPAQPAISAVTAPVVQAAATTTAALPEGSVDSTGLPWDERIHSSNREVKGDGTWRKKRGVAQLLVDQVEAQLRGVQIENPLPTPVLPQALALPAQPVVAPEVPALPTMAVPPVPNLALPQAPALPAQPVVAPEVPTLTLPQNPAAPVATPEHLPVPTVSLTRTFDAVLKRVQDNMKAKKLTSAAIAKMNEWLGVANITDIQSNPALVEKAHELLDAWVGVEQ
jgi:hypothetical protein